VIFLVMSLKKVTVEIGVIAQEPARKKQLLRLR
jgi:hypothetical protein